MSRYSDLQDLEFAVNAAYLADENFDLVARRGFFLEPTDGTSASSPASGTWALDELFVDTSRRVWRCTVAGTPGTWTLIASASMIGGVTNGYYAKRSGSEFGDGSLSETSPGRVFCGGRFTTQYLEFLDYPATNLTANNTTVTPAASIQPLSSNNATAANRRFSLHSPSSIDARQVILRWTGANAGQLLSSDTNLALSANWVPVDGDMLCLIWDPTNTKWRESWRYPVPSGGGIAAGDDVTWTGQHTFQKGQFFGANSETYWGAGLTAGELRVAYFDDTDGDPAAIEEWLECNDTVNWAWYELNLTKTRAGLELNTWDGGSFLNLLEVKTTEDGSYILLGHDGIRTLFDPLAVKNAGSELANYVFDREASPATGRLAWWGDNGTLKDELVGTGGSQHRSLKKTLTDAATSLFEIALPTLKAAGGRINWSIRALDATDVQCISGVTTYSVVNKGGVYTKELKTDTADSTSALSAGTLTATFTLLDGTNKVTLQVTPSGSLTETTYEIFFTVDNLSPQSVTIL